MAEDLHILNDSRRRRSKKEVKTFDKSFYFSILQDLKLGLNPQQISKKRKRSKQNIQYYISVLKNKGYVRKCGYGTWEVTKLGEIQRSKNFLWGSHRSKNKIEIWRLGYRFRIEHDNDIPELKEQTLARGGKVYQGRVLGCWITKGKETLDIYGSVAKSDNLMDALMLSMTEIVTCKAHLETDYHIKLGWMHTLKPDILINTPETQAIAKEIHDNVGRIRSELIDAGDSSKTGSPEFEAKTVGAAKNVLENLGRDNNGALLEKMNELSDLMKGMVAPIQSISNAQLMTATAYKQQTELLEKIAQRDTGSAETLVLDDKDESMEHIEIIKETPGFVGLYKGHVKHYRPLPIGARIYVEKQIAVNLIFNGYAKTVEGDIASGNA